MRLDETPKRLLLVACVCYGLFSNHWARDSLGALEAPIESDPPFALSVRSYNTVTSAYFLPSGIMPILAGILAQQYGSALVYLQFFAVAAVGNLVVGTAAVAGQATFSLLLVGRALMGVAYEAVDMMPIGFMAPRFVESWSTLVGVLNGVNRLGSVLNFVLEPHIYHAGGLRVAIAVPSIIGASGLCTALLAQRIDRSMQVAEAANGAAPKESKDIITRASFRQLPTVFWLYLAGGACVYGAVVPFWFIGAKHLQTRFGMTLAQADALLLLPEGLIAFVAPPFGILIDRYKR